MTTAFPTGLDNFTNPGPDDELDDAGVFHDEQHSNINDAVEALEAKVGVNNSSNPSSIDYKLTRAQYLTAPLSSVVPLTLRGAAAQTANLLELRNSANTLLSFINSAGSFSAGKVLAPTLADTNDAIGYLNMGGLGAAGSVAAVNKVAGNVGFTVKGVASQTADLQQWQDSTAAVLLKVTKDGILNATRTGVAVQVGPTSVIAHDSAGQAGGYMQSDSTQFRVGHANVHQQLSHYGYRFQEENDIVEMVQTVDSTHNIARYMRRFTDVGKTAYKEVQQNLTEYVMNITPRTKGSTYSSDITGMDGRWAFNWVTDTIAPDDTLIIKNRSGVEISRFMEEGRLKITRALAASPGLSFHLPSSQVPLAITPTGAADVVYVSGGEYVVTGGGWVARAASNSAFRQINDAFYWYGNNGLTAGSVYTPTAMALLARSGANSIFQLGGEFHCGDPLNNVAATFRVGSFTDPLNVYLEARGPGANVNMQFNSKGTGHHDMNGSSFNYYENGTGKKLFLVDNSGTVPGAAETSLGLYHNNTAKRIYVGAANSGGSGSRMLIIAN